MQTCSRRSTCRRLAASREWFADSWLPAESCWASGGAESHLHLESDHSPAGRGSISAIEAAHRRRDQAARRSIRRGPKPIQPADFGLGGWPRWGGSGLVPAWVPAALPLQRVRPVDLRDAPQSCTARGPSRRPRPDPGPRSEPPEAQERLSPARGQAGQGLARGPGMHATEPSGLHSQRSAGGQFQRPGASTTGTGAAVVGRGST